MKRYITLFLFAALLATACTQKPKDYTVLGQLFNAFGHGMHEKVKGKVKEFKQTHFWAEEENGKIVKGRIYTMEDRKVNPLGRDFIEEYNLSGTVTRSITYDDKGNVLLDIKVNTEGSMLTGSEYFINDAMRYKVSYKYKEGKMTEAIARDPASDTLIMSIRYEYDQSGNIVKTQNFDSKGEAQGYNTYESDDNGSPVKTRSFSKNGEMTSLHDYTYNEKGERTGHHEENFNTGAILDFTFKYAYDPRGNVSAIIFIKDGKPYIYRAREISYY